MRNTILLLLAASAFAETSPIKVYVTNHESWQQSSALVTGSYTGATRAEQTKTLAKGCPSITITDDQAKANYTVAWDSKTWQQTSWGGHESEFTVYNSANDMVGAGDAHHMKNAAKDICKLLLSGKH